jgi:hypothetical protein
MSMTKAAIAVGIFLALAISSPGQDVRQAEAKLVRSPFAGGDALHVIQEAALDLKEYASGAEDRVAVRVCSREPMPVALSTAAASPFILREYLEHYGFLPERILFLRSEDCLANNSRIAVTEFWAIPKGADVPRSVESIRSSQARLEVVRTEDTIKSAADYNAALRELIAKSSAKPEASVVIVGAYYKQPSSALKKNLHKAKRLLEKHGVPPNRVYVRAAPSSGIREGDEPEPKYPNLFVVEISDSARR